MIARGCRLMWEEWRRTRNIVVIMVLVLSAMSVLVWTMETRKHGWPAAVWSCFMVYGLVMYLLLSQSTRSNIHMSIPTRRFRLPMTSFELAFWPFLYRLAVVSVGAGFVSILNRLVTPDFAVVAPFCIFWLILSALHTVSYASPLLNKWVVGLLLFLLLWPAPAFFARHYRALGWHYPGTDFACMAIAAAVTLVLTTAAIGKIRSGGWNTAATRRSRVQQQNQIAQSDAGRQRRAFRSADRAQIWFEWRSSVRSVVLLMAFVTLAVVVSEVSSANSYPDEPYTMDMSLAIIVLVANSAVVGLWAFANQTARNQRNASMFVQTRPVSDFRLARGKLETSLLTILVNVTVVTLIFLAINFVAWVTGAVLASAFFLRCVFPGFDIAGTATISALLTLLALTPFVKVPLKIAHARHQ